MVSTLILLPLDLFSAFWGQTRSVSGRIGTYHGPVILQTVREVVLKWDVRGVERVPGLMAGIGVIREQGAHVCILALLHRSLCCYRTALPTNFPQGLSFARASGADHLS